MKKTTNFAKKEDNNTTRNKVNKFSLLNVESDTDDENTDDNVTQLEQSKDKLKDKSKEESKEESKDKLKEQTKDKFKEQSKEQIKEQTKNKFKESQFKNRINIDGEDSNESKSLSNDFTQYIKKEQFIHLNKNEQYFSRDSVDNSRRRDFGNESKITYTDSLSTQTLNGNDLYMNSSWTVWAHKSDCESWTEDSYTNIYVINSVGSFWRFFNNFHLIDKTEYQLFIMRNKIKPIWEDNSNRNGGTCSIMLNCHNRQGKIDSSIEIMICICMLIMNETFLQRNDEINGVSYAIKNGRVLIKLWCKTYTVNIPDQLPVSLFNKFNDSIKYSDNYSHPGKRLLPKISVKYSPIRPEYDFN